MLVGRLMQAELVENAGHMPLDGGHRDHQLVRYAGVGMPFCDQRQHLPLPRRQLIERAGLALAAHQPRDHIGIENRPAVGDPAYRIGEHARGQATAADC